MYGLIFFIKFGKFSVIISSNMCSAPLPSSPLALTYTHRQFDIAPQIIEALCQFFKGCFLSVLKFGYVFGSILKITNYFFCSLICYQTYPMNSSFQALYFSVLHFLLNPSSIPCIVSILWRVSISSLMFFFCFKSYHFIICVICGSVLLTSVTFFFIIQLNFPASWVIQQF